MIEVIRLYMFVCSAGVTRTRLHASNMTRKLKEMSAREQNIAEEKEKTDEAKPEQGLASSTIKRGKENACGFRKHLNLEQKNSMEKYRPKCKKVWEEL